MSTWNEFMLNHAKENQGVPAWPYPVLYGNERSLSCDVLVFGGGIAGCHAAVSARRAGANVIVADKEAVKWSGNGGAGVDHWLSACTNPCSKVSPEDFTERIMADTGGYDCGPLRYINARESWDTLLDCEKMGVQIRDVNDEFAGAAFRDEKTRLLFAYDYENRYDLRIYGHNMKPSLHREMRRLGVEIIDRLMLTALLTEGSGERKRAAGAMGIHTRTGEFYILKAKAVILATGLPGRMWLFSTENRPTFRDPNITAEGVAAAWNAGAEFVRLEESFSDASPLSYIAYAVGNAHNTWHGCPIVDATGKEIPWTDRDGREFRGAKERFLPSPGQGFMVGHGLRVPPTHENHVRELDPKLPERIRKGEIILPLYADLSRLPASERRAIFGLMVGNEGKTRVPVYETLTKAGFDPDKDMLQVPVMNPEAYGHANFWAGMNVPHWRQWGCGGLMVDWDLATNIEGLYAAGGAIFGAGAHSSAAASGRYAGRKAAGFALASPELGADRGQIDREKERVYAPLKAKGLSIGWKELNAGICRIMQDYCGQYKSEDTLKEGLSLLAGVREAEAKSLQAVNPHELARCVECLSIITSCEAVLQACLARRASSGHLNFFRLDYPDIDPPAWRMHLAVRLSADGPAVRGVPLDYHLRAPFAPSYEENYKARSVNEQRDREVLS